MPNRFSFKWIQKLAPGNERGVALVIVLASLMLLTTIVVELMLQSKTQLNIAMNERDRMQAFYLAQSALNFTKIVIQNDKAVQQEASKISKQLGRTIKVPHLYQMLPIHSSMLKGMIQIPKEVGDSNTTEEGKGAYENPNSTPFHETDSDLEEGIFKAQVEILDGKIPLNAFYGLAPTQVQYDRLKNVLIYLFRQKAFENLLKDPARDSLDLASKMADFIDKNDVINEIGGGERGLETSLYAGSLQKPKNAKLLTLSELMLLPGMNDAILEELKKHVTVYRSADTINACDATSEVLRAMMIAYTQNRTDMEALRPEDEDRLQQAESRVRSKCPETLAMGQAFNEVMQASGTLDSGSKPLGTSSGGASGGFGSMLSNTESIVQIEAYGIKGRAELKMTNVLDVSSPTQDQWKNLYWRVE